MWLHKHFGGHVHYFLRIVPPLSFEMMSRWVFFLYLSVVRGEYFWALLPIDGQEILQFLPLTPLRSHVSHTHAQTDTHSSRAGWRNPNVLISRDKHRQGEHWAALTHRETTPISWLIKEVLRPHLRPLKPPGSPSSWWSTPPERGRLISAVWNRKYHKCPKLFQGLARHLSMPCCATFPLFGL